MSFWGSDMSRYLFDTNVLLDFAIPSRPQHNAAVKLVSVLCDDERSAIFVFASSLKDVYYVFNRHYGDEPTARRLIGKMREVFEIAPLSAMVVDEALASDEPDFEDGLVRAAAEVVFCDYIVSRDVKAFRTSSCVRIDALQGLEML